MNGPREFRPEPGALQDLPIPAVFAVRPPAPPVAHGIEGQVCADIARRQLHGLAKYGVTVADNPLDLRAWLVHAYEEQLDGAVYLRRAIAELDAQQAASNPTPQPGGNHHAES